MEKAPSANCQHLSVHRKTELQVSDIGHIVGEVNKCNASIQAIFLYVSVQLTAHFSVHLRRISLAAYPPCMNIWLNKAWML